MALKICTTCGTQFAADNAPRGDCPVCVDERQFVPASGQAWTDLDALRADHRNVWRDEGPHVRSVTTEPTFAIGQRGLLVETQAARILWDCISMIDDATIAEIEAGGGLDAIAISHPHFYTTMAEWSDALDVPVFVHAADADWIRRMGPQIQRWSGETLEIADGVRLIRCGGHFPGAAVMSVTWEDGTPPALFTGDTLQVTLDRRHVSFMYSYPNLIPVDAATVRAIETALDGVAFDAIYGGFADRTIESGGREAFDRSVARYLTAIGS